MYCSDQILDISCTEQDFPKVLDFAISLYGRAVFTRSDGRMKMAYAEPVPGIYALGTGSMEPYRTGPNKGWAAEIGRGWTDFPCDYDPKIIAPIAAQWLSRHKPAETTPMTDGSVEQAVRAMSLHTACMAGVLPPVYDIRNWAAGDCILILAPCWMSYDK